jgi:S-DNA-T family DNA segregation ATPase FtsK/SpoIIIE
LDFTPYRDEIILIITVVISLLSLFSIIGIGGIAGKWLRTFLFGTMGLTGYLFPFVLFFSVVFILSNYKNKRALSKICCCIGIYFVLMGLLQLLFYADEDVSVLEAYFLCAKSTLGGGFLGGILSIPLKSVIGTAGTYVVLIAIILILVMFVTSRFLFSALGRQGKRSFTKMHRKYQAERLEKTMIRESYGELPPRRRRPSVTFDLQEETERKPEEAVKETTKPAASTTASKTKKKKKETDMQEYQPSVDESIPITQTSQEIKQELEESFLPLEPDGMSYRPSIRFVDDKEQEGYTRKNPDEEVDYIDYSGEKAGGQEVSAQEERTLNKMPPEKQDFKEAELKAASGTSGTAQETASRTVSKTVSRILPETTNTELETSIPQNNIFDEAPAYSETSNEDLHESYETPSYETTNDQAAEELSVSDLDPDAAIGHDPSFYAGTFERFTEEKKFDGSVLEGTQDKDAVNPQVYSDYTSAGYIFPPMDLLSPPSGRKSGKNMAEIEATTEKLRQTFESFKVRVTFGNVSCGPAVTRYEIQPEQGVKVSKITNLADDIKLTLAASDIRIEAPIPGKAAIGIEVPNKETSAVMLRELLESDEFINHKSNIAFAVGKDIGGQPVVTDIGKMPHLLIAGATGSGKSVCINTLIMSILYKSNPDDVKLIMVDPKVVELSVYNGIPHLLIPVVTDPKKASAALNWAVMEMTDRYGKFAELGVRDLSGYNRKIAEAKAAAGGQESEKYQKLPQIIIIVDELADLMMVAPGEVEDAICRLAQMARAAGLHLVIATQRPSVNVITGVIKANVPSRIAFSVSSAVDSRTIIDGVGAEKLLGKGDMLFFPSGLPKPIRVQGAFVSDNEVSRVVEFLREQNKEHSYNNDISDKITAAAVSGGGSDSAEHDEYFNEAGKFIIEKDKASIGMLQRVYKIGFNRAARIMDQLADAGVVGPEEGTKPRKVLMSLDEFERYVEEYL